jgi:predicted RNA-binding Zn ribbon-like protein
MEATFLLVAGHLALDFLNTEIVGDSKERIDLLTASESVIAWFQAAGIAPVPVAESSLLEEARNLRKGMQQLVLAWKQDLEAPTEARVLLNQILATGASSPVLAPDFTAAREPVVAIHPLFPVAEAAWDLLTQHDRALVRQCGGTDCILWFLDTTKNKRRRWCRMEVCGNREKVAAHYHRHHKKENGE